MVRPAGRFIQTQAGKPPVKVETKKPEEKKPDAKPTPAGRAAIARESAPLSSGGPSAARASK